MRFMPLDGIAGNASPSLSHVPPFRSLEVSVDKAHRSDVMKMWKALSLIIGLGSVVCSYAISFDGYQCSDDCSGHQAGYDWAQQNQIDDESSSCSTPSNSFNEGCASYVQSGPVTALDDEDEDD
jgi:hypothetical protein